MNYRIEKDEAGEQWWERGWAERKSVKFVFQKISIK